MIGGLESAVGNTPLIRINSLSELTNCNIYGKCEFMNPSGSVKDRTALAIIKDAEKTNKLQKGGTIVEGTGGNTGISLAQLGTSHGYKVILYVPNSISQEKIDLMRILGATLYMQPIVPFSDPENYAKKAQSEAELNGYCYANQFENHANYLTHFNTTGPEIYHQLGDTPLHAFITSCGTGGTYAGISSYLKSQNENIKCYISDCHGSILHDYVKTNIPQNTTGRPTSVMEGIGIGRLTANFLAGKVLTHFVILM
jgi:cysteine synthase A